MTSAFADALRDRDVVLTFGLTPPRADVTPERADKIASATLQRLQGIDLDSLVIYDLADESDRTDVARPFPFMQTMDPWDFLRDHLGAWDGTAVLYRSAGKYAPGELTDWFGALPSGAATVLVGPASSRTPVKTDLVDAQRMLADVRPDVPLGAVAIPERHASTGTEHDRLLAKQDLGASFFVTQVVYDVTEAKDMASDYFYACQERGVQPGRVIFTLSLCGSMKTLAFLEWLGVDVPKWVRNDLQHARDPLSRSLLHAQGVARELRAFCASLGLPCGFNVESVSIRRVEIEAAVHLARQLAFEMRAN